MDVPFSSMAWQASARGSLPRIRSSVEVMAEAVLYYEGLVSHAIVPGNPSWEQLDNSHFNTSRFMSAYSLK